MKLLLEDLFRYRQYTDRPPEYCYDRYTGRICQIKESCKKEERFLPLFRIDARRIESRFLSLRKEAPPRQKTNCFGEQMQRRGLWEAWWNYYKNEVYQAARTWCDVHAVPYQER